MSCIAKTLKSNCSLKELYLDDAKIGKHNDSVKSYFFETERTNSWLVLFSALKQNLTIHTLSICRNRFTEEEFSALKDLLHNNKVITTLKVVACGFTVTQLSQLEQELPNKDCLVASTKQLLVNDLQQKQMIFENY